MNLYFIRQKSTGYYLPEPNGRAGRGGSHTEPNPDSSLARIFRSERSAKIALNAWLKGKYVADRWCSDGHPGNDWEPNYYEDIRIVPVPQRKREDMEIVSAKIPMGNL